jgi:polyisoprenoid-binding protein YceI
MRRKSLILALPLVLLTGFAARRASLQQYDIQDPKGANGFSFSMIDGLEPIHGQGNDVSGSIMLDLEHPEKSKGKVVIGVKALKLTSDVMTNNMMGEWCLDAEKHPTATFEVTSGKVKKAANGEYEGTATGNLTLKGITKVVSVPVTARLVKGGVKERFGDKDGDLLMFSTKFTFNRFDYEIGKAVKQELLSNKVEVRLSCAGMLYR